MLVDVLISDSSSAKLWQRKLRKSSKTGLKKKDMPKFGKVISSFKTSVGAIWSCGGPGSLL